MSRPIRAAFTAAAGLALALIALPARADHDGDRDRRLDRDRHEVLAPPVAYPPPAYEPGPPATRRYRHAHWRDGDRRELRREYRRLEFARERFYASWDHNPWSRSRFESWYGWRRAELDRRWAELYRW
jgi:hypothetical protein